MRKVSPLLALAAIAGAGIASATTSGWAPYKGRHSSSRISFLHPSEWKARFAGFTWPPYGSPQYLIVALSTERLHNPNCHDVPQPDGTSTTVCDPILESLPPEGVYVTWWENDGIFQPDRTGVPGNPARIGGVFATIVIEPSGVGPPGACPKSTSGSVQVYIPGTATAPHRPVRPEVNMYACTQHDRLPALHDPTPTNGALRPIPGGQVGRPR